MKPDSNFNSKVKQGGGEQTTKAVQPARPRVSEAINSASALADSGLRTFSDANAGAPMKCNWNEEVLLVLTNLPDHASAQRLAQALVSSRAAACVNVLAECTSVYRWQGAVETAREVPLLIKSTRSAYARLQEEIRAQHPYELPEIIAIPLSTGLPAYLQWVANETQFNNKD